MCKNRKNSHVENKKFKSQLFRFIPLVHEIDTDTRRDLRHPSSHLIRMSTSIMQVEKYILMFPGCDCIYIYRVSIAQ